MIRLPSQQNIQGFSLIQVSVLLIVGTVILTSLLPGSGAGDYNQKVTSNTAKLDAVETAMIAFMSKNGRRPCPADGQYNLAQANFGVEAATPGTCTGGTPAAPMGPDAITTYVVGGTIPTKTLNLPDEYAFDAWGRQFTYLVDKRATLASSASATSCYSMQNSATKGAISVNNAITNNDGSDTIVSTDNVMAAYISHGPTGHGAFPSGGSTVTARINRGITDTDTLTNAGVNSSFTYTTTNFAGVGATSTFNRVKKDRTAAFDNLVYYRKDTMNTCCNGGGCTANPIPGYVAQGAANDSAGTSLAIGDVNGDGIDDLIIGAPGSGAGHVYVIFGNNTTFSSTITLSGLAGATTPAGIILNGASSGDQFGQSVAIGDINGDGVKDVIVGAPGYSSGAGAVYVIFGNKTWSKSAASGVSLSMNAPDGTTYFRIDANNATDSTGGATPHTGTSVAAGNIAGHTNSTQDVIIGVPGANVVVSATNYPAAGKVYVLFGSTSGSPPWSGGIASLATAANNNGTNGFDIDNDDSIGTITSVPGQVGYSVAAGNLNNDSTNNGADDVIIGAPYAERGNFSNSGKVYVVFGSKNAWSSPFVLSGLNGGNGFTIAGAPSSYTGQSVAAGDINGNGIADLIIGAPHSSPGLARASAGSTYVIFGQSSWSATQDLAAGYPSMTTSPATGFRQDGSTSETSGTAVAAGCSPIGNGIPALLIGAPAAGTYDGGNSCTPTTFPTSTNSNSYVVFGSSSDPTYSTNCFVGVENLCTLNTTGTLTVNSISYSVYTNGFYAKGLTSGDKLGTAIAGLDINRTGKCAIAIGAPGANSNAGYVYLILGQPSFSSSFDLSTLR